MMPKAKINHPPVRVLDAGNVILVNNSSLSPVPKMCLCSVPLPPHCYVCKRGHCQCVKGITPDYAAHSVKAQRASLHRTNGYFLFFFRKNKKKSQMSKCLWSPLHSLFKVVDLKCLSLVKYPHQREEPAPQRCIKSREFKGTRSVAII